MQNKGALTLYQSMQVALFQYLFKQQPQRKDICFILQPCHHTVRSVLMVHAMYRRSFFHARTCAARQPVPLKEYQDLRTRRKCQKSSEHTRRILDSIGFFSDLGVIVLYVLIVVYSGSSGTVRGMKMISCRTQYKSYRKKNTHIHTLNTCFTKWFFSSIHTHLSYVREVRIDRWRCASKGRKDAVAPDRVPVWV
jgi:hypothetical protein